VLECVKVYERGGLQGTTVHFRHVSIGDANRATCESQVWSEPWRLLTTRKFEYPKKLLSTLSRTACSQTPKTLRKQIHYEQSPSLKQTRNTFLAYNYAHHTHNIETPQPHKTQPSNPSPTRQILPRPTSQSQILPTSQSQILLMRQNHHRAIQSRCS